MCRVSLYWPGYHWVLPGFINSSIRAAESDGCGNLPWILGMLPETLIILLSSERLCLTSLSTSSTTSKFWTKFGSYLQVSCCTKWVGMSFNSDIGRWLWTLNGSDLSNRKSIRLNLTLENFMTALVMFGINGDTLGLECFSISGVGSLGVKKKCEATWTVWRRRSNWHWQPRFFSLKSHIRCIS